MLALFRFLLPALAFAVLASCNASPEAQTGPVVLAASSMQEALTEAGSAWEASGHSAPVLSFAASSALARQVESGAPADMFISADGEWMDHVERAGMVSPGSRANLAGNSLVMIGPAQADGARWDGKRASLLAALGEGRLAMADPASVPAGRYARAALQSLGVWDVVAERIAAGENVRAAMAMVERGQAPLGIVYGSDAQASGLPVLFTFPEGSHPVIAYPVAVLSGSHHPDTPDFRDFLLSEYGQAILVRHGFKVGK